MRRLKKFKVGGSDRQAKIRLEADQAIARINAIADQQDSQDSSDSTDDDNYSDDYSDNYDVSSRRRTVEQEECGGCGGWICCCLIMTLLYVFKTTSSNAFQTVCDKVKDGACDALDKLETM